MARVFNFARHDREYYIFILWRMCDKKYIGYIYNDFSTNEDE